jgi:hemoglobin
MTDPPTIYDAIGGAPAISAAVELFYERVLRDPSLRGFFAGSDLPRLKQHQRAFFTMALRGTGAYTGKTMRAAHAGRGITDADFDRVAQHLAATLGALGVPDDLTSQIIGAIAPLRRDIVDQSAGAEAAA